MKKKSKIFFDFFDFFRKGQKTKKIKKIKKMKKKSGTLGLPAWGVSGRGNPSLPDPEWLQAGALAGALDSPCGGTLDFFDFFDFFRKTKKMKKINFFLIFLIFFEKPKK